MAKILEVVVPIEMLTDQVGVIPGGVNIGVVVVDSGRCLLIDTGLNETSAKRAVKAVREELNREVAAIITTHAHADHFGGNATVVKRTGASVYAPVVDEVFLRYPILQPSMLFAGADPPPSLRGRFLLADPSPVDHLIDGDRLAVEGVEFEVVSLAGHSPNQLGLVIDDVFFCADIVLPANVLEKYRIPYLYSLTDHLASLQRAVKVRCRVAVPGHGPTLSTLDDLIDLNQAVIGKVLDKVLELLAEPQTPEVLLTRVLSEFGADVSDPAGYYLLHPTVFAYLSYLEQDGRAVQTVEGFQNLWRRADA